ncbi:hypothetical protein AAE02nite_45900 [Adhaeribacter aerolatus]|uniref:Type 9 secretion system plug protein N-terminal domain-containing protein n=1 Tax=Adhaeribacter aerolatus TaxID=670289 RepID=A0A512B4M1_9BACT|nr:DUF5103 domain-containing protein [Adhaeribacter aerolatus]GEO06926.1 hypothetical protein AAE02nite_45900 [Adhaeribacter aerolatus]
MGAGTLKALVIFSVILLAFIWYSCVPLAQQTTGGTTEGAAEYYADTQLRSEDFVYDNNVKSVQCYVRSGHPEEVLNPPVVPLSQEQPMVLEFDQLNSPQQRFLVKFIYCNADWTEARITQAQFMPDFNEFYITDITPSFNTKVKFFHYRFVVPAVKLSGNYLMVVSDQRGRNILSRRLLVYEQRVTVGARPVLPAGAQERQTYQQIDFEIRYNQYPLVNPSQEVKVTLRQNNRWHNAKLNLKPLYVRDTERKLEFTYFNLENSFPGLNEYRYFDTRSMRSLGANVATANREAVPEEILLLPDKSRARDAFSSQEDINGKYLIGNREYGNGAINGDYNWVTFNLASPQPAAGNVYVFGELSDWQLKKDFQLSYDAANHRYTGRALLKQGYYNYDYAVQTSGIPDERYYEGSFNLTENQYDIIVYYRPPGARTDLIIGYQPVNYNARR